MSVTLGIIATVVFALFFILLFAKLLADRKLAGKMAHTGTTEVEEFKDAAIRLGVACFIALAILAFSFRTNATNGDIIIKEQTIDSEKATGYPVPASLYEVQGIVEKAHY